MRCFYHPEHNAVGICSSCHRGICIECAREIGKSLACAQKCEEDVTIDEVRIPTIDGIRAQLNDGQSLPFIFGPVGLLILSWSVPPAILLHNREVVIFIIFGVMYLLIVVLSLANQYFRKRRRQNSSRHVQ